MPRTDSEDTGVEPPCAPLPRQRSGICSGEKVVVDVQTGVHQLGGSITGTNSDYTIANELSEGSILLAGRWV